MLRRVAGDRHRRRHDPGSAVRGPVRKEGGAGRHLEPRARRPLQERHQPPALPALHRHYPAALRRGRDGGRPGLPPGPHGRGQGVVLASGRRGAAGLRDPVVRPEGRRAGGAHRPTGAGPRGEAGAHGRRHGARDLQRAVQPSAGTAGLSRRRAALPHAVPGRRAPAQPGQPPRGAPPGDVGRCALRGQDPPGRPGRGRARGALHRGRRRLRVRADGVALQRDAERGLAGAA